MTPISVPDLLTLINQHAEASALLSGNRKAMTKFEKPITETWLNSSHQFVMAGVDIRAAKSNTPAISVMIEQIERLPLRAEAKTEWVVKAKQWDTLVQAGAEHQRRVEGIEKTLKVELYRLERDVRENVISVTTAIQDRVCAPVAGCWAKTREGEIQLDEFRKSLRESIPVLRDLWQRLAFLGSTFNTIGRVGKCIDLLERCDALRENDFAAVA